MTMNDNDNDWYECCWLPWAKNVADQMEVFSGQCFILENQTCKGCREDPLLIEVKHKAWGALWLDDICISFDILWPCFQPTWLGTITSQWVRNHEWALADSEKLYLGHPLKQQQRVWHHTLWPCKSHGMYCSVKYALPPPCRWFTLHHGFPFNLPSSKNWMERDRQELWM